MITITLKDGKKERVDLEVQEISVSKGDTLVLKYPGSLAPTASAKILESIGNLFPGARAIILEEGLSIEGVIKGEFVVSRVLKCKCPLCRDGYGRNSG